tara:strand:- start:642 stop:1238 length:597 start_codon:yes stop_codon:yes gene_type:complete
MRKLNEGLISRTADLFYAFRFLKLLTTSWNKMSAFELGIIDDSGKVIKKPKTNEEKSAYTVFHRLVFNVKRLVSKLPFGKTKLASYATALFLIKEHTGIPESKLRSIMEEVIGEKIPDQYFNENKWFESDTGLNQGVYILIEDAVSPITGDVIALKNTKVEVKEKTEAHSNILGKNIYKVIHIPTQQEIYISNGDIKR